MPTSRWSYFSDLGVIAQQHYLAPYLNLKKSTSTRITYSRLDLLGLKGKFYLSSEAFSSLKHLKILNTRRNRAGRRHKRQSRNISPIITNRNQSSSNDKHRRGVNQNNLVLPLRIPFTPVIRKKATFCLLNTRSVCNKALFINDFVSDNNVDVVCLTETWHKI